MFGFFRRKAPAEIRAAIVWTGDGDDLDDIDCIDCVDLARDGDAEERAEYEHCIRITGRAEDGELVFYLSPESGNPDEYRLARQLIYAAGCAAKIRLAEPPPLVGA